MKKVSIKTKVRNKNKSENIIRLTITAQKYCTGCNSFLLENGRSEFAYLLTSDLNWIGARQNGKFRPLCILNFVHSGANRNENSTGLAPSMTSSHVTSQVTLESSVFIILKYT